MATTWTWTIGRAAAAFSLLILLLLSLVASSGSCASADEQQGSGIHGAATATHRRFLQARQGQGQHDHHHPSSSSPTPKPGGGGALSSSTHQPSPALSTSTKTAAATTPHQPESGSPSSSSTSLRLLLPRWAIYALSISGAALLVAVAPVCLYLFLSRRRKKEHTVTPWSTGLSGPLRKALVTGVPALGRPELEAACEGFVNVVGASSGCTMYKGTLSSGVEIAVVAASVGSHKEWSDTDEEHFRNKISTLSRVSHKNFVNLLGYCACDDEPFTRMMVFEYAPCGSLFEHLHVREAEDLDWRTRLRVITGVANCLEHMTQLDPSVPSPPLTSSSVYLTDDYAAKLADVDFFSHKSLDDSKLDTTTSSDLVYSFGALLLEVVSGRRPISGDRGLLVLWASSYLNGARPLAAMVDPALRGKVDEGVVAGLCDVVRVCVRADVERRPDMAEVARMVRGVTGFSTEQAVPRGNPLWWAELEIAQSEESCD